MKVIHFAPYFPPGRLGGVGEFVAGLHEELLARGHESTVVTTGVESNAEVHRISRSPFRWFLKIALWARKAEQYDVVHCQSGEAISLVLAMNLLGKRTPILATFHVSYHWISKSFKPYSLGGREFAREWKPGVYRTIISAIHTAIDRLTIRFADDVNTISIASNREIFASTARKSNNIIYYGLSPLLSPPAVNGIDRVSLFYAGAPGHRKRVNALPLILEHVREEIPDAKLRIAGFDLEDQPELYALFKERDLLPWVDCIGVKPSKELAPYYASADMVVVPSAYEGLPFVILESMRVGTPVVATRVSGHGEAIEDGVNGFLVEPDDPRALAACCVQLIRDSELRERLGEAARVTVAEKFSIARQVDEYLELYERIRKRAGDA